MELKLTSIAFLMAFVYSLICVEVRDTLRITYFGFGPTEMRALLIAGNLITLRSGVLDVGQWFAPRGWHAVYRTKISEYCQYRNSISVQIVAFVP